MAMRTKKIRDRAEIDRRTAKRPELAVAGRVASKFHGGPVRWVRDAEEETIFRKNYAVLGRLLSLVVERNGRRYPIQFPESPETALGATPDGKTLVPLGGDQRIDLAALGLPRESADKDHVDLGRVVTIVYFARKSMDANAPVEYTHHFGTPGGRGDLLTSSQAAARRSEDRWPRLIYDALNARLTLAGGAYTIRKEGLVY